MFEIQQRFSALFAKDQAQVADDSDIGACAGRASRPLHTLLLFLLVLVVYNANLRLGHSGDDWPARYLPFSLLRSHDVYLDPWVDAYLPAGLLANAHYLSQARGHWMSSYPIIAPVLVSPLYVWPARWVDRTPAPGRARLVFLLAPTMEKLSATLLAALSVAFLYLALEKILSPGASLLLALIYGLASNTWTISSQNLWLHGLSELSFTLLLWAVLDGLHQPRAALLAGLALALAGANKPTNLLFLLCLLPYLARHHRKRFLLFLAPLFAVGCFVLAYNFYYFGNLFGAYPEAHRKVGYSGLLAAFQGSLLTGIPGLLVSPSRGLFIYMPWTIFAFWGAARLWRENQIGGGRYLVSGTLLLFLLTARYDRWWGGYCFGPRYLTDLLPFLAFFLVPVWRSIRAIPVLRAIFALSVAASLWVQVVGAFYYTWRWDHYPASVDTHRERLWDWSDTQLMRNWRAGPADPVLKPTLGELWRWVRDIEVEVRRPGAAPSSPQVGR